MTIIPFDQFTVIELRVGTVTKVEAFPKARKPAFKIWADFGPAFGVWQTSAQVTVHYAPETLVGTQILGCLNLGERNIGGFVSQFLCCGLPDENGEVVLVRPDKAVPNGGKLF